MNGGPVLPKRLVKRLIRRLGLVAEVNTVASIQAVVLMNIEPMVRGYVLANRRLHDAVARSFAPDIYIALFEISNWLDSLSELTAA